MNTGQVQILCSVFICVHRLFHFGSTMAHVAIDAHASCPVAVDAPSHRLIHFATHSMHLSNLAMTRNAFEPRAYVGLVRVENICLGFVPVHSTPRRLLLALGECCQFLNLPAFGQD